MSDETNKPGSYASPPCLAHEIDPAYFDPLAVDPQQAQDVARWRKAERARLLAERAALPVAERQAAAGSIAEHLDRLLAARFDSLAGLTISAWWPIKAEIDLRFWLAGLAARGARAALPLVATKAAPLIFREWTPQTRMERGFWNIPVPAEGPDDHPRHHPVAGRRLGRCGLSAGLWRRLFRPDAGRPCAAPAGHRHRAGCRPHRHDLSTAA